MGLDITAYRKLAKVIIPEGAEAADYPAPRMYHNPAFPGRADDVPEGSYIGLEEFGFRAGSYGGYGEWRNQLAEFAGYAEGVENFFGGERKSFSATAFDAKGGPFWELICFSDCEGTIGTAISAKLAKDFAENQPRADAYDGPDAEWFKARYADWRKAFEMAADGGAVEFH